MIKTTLDFVFIDTSFFKAILDEKDEFYIYAVSIWKKLQLRNVSLVTSNYILDEVFTLIRKRRGISKAKEFRQLLIDNATSIKIVRVTSTDEGKAWSWFLKDWHDLSFTDCVSFALMERLGLRISATFDKHFIRAGFKAAS